MNQTPTFKLREDAILADLERELDVHGEDVLTSALSEFFMRGRRVLLKRVTAAVTAQARAAETRKRSARIKAEKEAGKRLVAAVTLAAEQGVTVIS